MSSPGANKPADRIPDARKFLTDRGHDLPLGVGEYNGYSATTISCRRRGLAQHPQCLVRLPVELVGRKGCAAVGRPAGRLPAHPGRLALRQAPPGLTRGGPAATPGIPQKGPPMEPISRRSALRLAGGAAGASGVAGVALLGGGSLLDPASAAGGRKIKARLNRATFRPGEVMRLRVTELLRPGRKIQVVDSTGLRWKRIARSGNRQVWTATAQRNGVGTVHVRVLWPDGRAVRNRHYRDQVTYRVAGPTTV